MTTPHHPENAISLFIEAFQSVDPDGKRLAKVFRDSFDQIYDGQHTGRYSIEQLSKTESAHLGSIVEINIRREFDDIINDGEVMDFEIKDYEVDCKYSKSRFGWMIPPFRTSQDFSNHFEHIFRTHLAICPHSAYAPKGKIIEPLGPCVRITKFLERISQ